MLSAPAEGGIRNAIDGLASDGSHAAILDADGKVVVSSPEFAELEINPEELARLSMDALGERDRMIKRRIKAGVAGPILRELAELPTTTRAVHPFGHRKQG